MHRRLVFRPMRKLQRVDAAQAIFLCEASDWLKAQVINGAVEQCAKSGLTRINRCDGIYNIAGSDLPKRQATCRTSLFDQSNEIVVVLPVPRKAEVIIAHGSIINGPLVLSHPSIDPMAIEGWSGWGGRTACFGISC